VAQVYDTDAGDIDRGAHSDTEGGGDCNDSSTRYANAFAYADAFTYAPAYVDINAFAHAFLHTDDDTHT
jgi:hypothetical protein